MKKQTTIEEKNEYQREIDLMVDLKDWIKDESFEPPFPYNVLWDKTKPKTQLLRILAMAAQRAYDDAIANELYTE